MRAAVERGMRLASVEFAREVIATLSREGALTCSLDQAISMFDFDTVSVVSSRSKASKKRESKKGEKKVSAKAKITAKPTVILPFCGEIQGDWCLAVKFCHGLHTQCTQGRVEGEDYCKTCRKHADGSATGKPPYGDMRDRGKYGVDYRDPKGKLTIPYAHVVEKLGISLEAAHAAASTLSWTIPEEQLVKRLIKRGRPAKSAAVSDTDSESGEETKTSKKGKRGRPKVKKSKAKTPTQDDQIAMLVAEAYQETTTTPAVKKVKAKKVKVKKPKLTAEQKEVAKQATLKLKEEKAATKELEKQAKQEAALKLKEEKAATKELEKQAKKEAYLILKAEKKALALKLKQEKAAAKKASKVTVTTEELEEEEIEEIAEEKQAEEQVVVEVPIEDIPELDSSDDEMEEDEGIELSEKMVVGDVEYYYSDQDGQIVLFTLAGEPVGVYDEASDTVVEAAFDDE